MLKKTLSIILSVLLLLSLTACGKQAEKPAKTTPTTTTTAPAEPQDENYVAAMAKLEEGKWQEAYDLFKASTDPKAAAELEKFVFVPTTVTCKNSLGQDLVHTYTYDERGNLLSRANKGDYSWTVKSDSETTYTYDDHNRKLTETYRFQDETSLETYTYDEDGNELTYTYRNYSGAVQNGYTCTYDQRGNLVKKEYMDKIDAAYNYTEVFTYDEQDRLLTRTRINYDGKESVRTYAYEVDGSYRYIYDWDDFDVNYYTYTYWYDTEDRIVKHELLNKITNEIDEAYETRYDEQGNEVYHRSVYNGKEYITNSTYNEQGKLLTSETTEDGELYAMSVYTYNEAGKPLTYERMYGVDWDRTTYTYDEQNRLVTEKSTGNTGWSNYTYTYDEAGNRIKEELDGVDTDYVCEYTYDAYGNILTSNYTKDSTYSGLTVEQNAAQWELRYYPEGYSEEVGFAISNAQNEVDPI